MAVPEVYVGQLPFATTETDITNFFYSEGSVKSIKFFPDPGSDKTKHAIVTFLELETAQKAVAFKSRSTLNDAPVTVAWNGRDMHRSNYGGVLSVRPPPPNPNFPNLPRYTFTTPRPNSPNQPMRQSLPNQPLARPNLPTHPPRQNSPGGVQHAADVSSPSGIRNVRPPLLRPFSVKSNDAEAWKCRDPHCSRTNEINLQSCAHCSLDRTAKKIGHKENGRAKNMKSKQIHYADDTGDSNTPLSNAKGNNGVDKSKRNAALSNFCDSASSPSKPSATLLIQKKGDESTAIKSPISIKKNPSVEANVKLNAELELIKEKNQRLQDQVAFFQKFDFEHQLNSLIDLQKGLLEIKKTVEKPESDFPKELFIDILERLRPFVSLDVYGMSKKAETSMGFYKTCRNMVEEADESLKNAFRSSLDGAAEGAALTLRELLGGLPHHQAMAMRSEISFALESIKPEITSSKELTLTIHHPVLSQELDSILNLLKPDEEENKILSLSELEEQEPNEAIDSLINGFLATIEMLRNPAAVNRPVPLLHDLAFEAVHALEIEKKSRTEQLGRPDEFEIEIRQKIFSFLNRADAQLKIMCQLCDESRANAAMIEQRHQNIQILSTLDEMSSSSDDSTTDSPNLTTDVFTGTHQPSDISEKSEIQSVTTQMDTISIATDHATLPDTSLEAAALSDDVEERHSVVSCDSDL